MYVLPVLTYGLELFNLKQGDIQSLESFQIKTFRQLLGLPNNTPSCALLTLLGALPVSGIIDKKILSMLGNILRSSSSVEYSILMRQLAVKNIKSSSWIILARRTLSRYQLPSLFALTKSIPTKATWKRIVVATVHRYWEDVISHQLPLYPSLRYMSHQYIVGQLHPAISSVKPTLKDVRRCASKLRLLTGTYTLQGNRPRFNQFNCDACPLCMTATETREHFICECLALSEIRVNSLQIVQQTLRTTKLDYRHLTSPDLTALIIDPKAFILRSDVVHTVDPELIESATRHMVYQLHSRRRSLLGGSTVHTQ